jgi:hypothetical protein
MGKVKKYDVIINDNVEYRIIKKVKNTVLYINLKGLNLKFGIHMLEVKHY